MPLGIDQLPYDLLFMIAAILDLEDVCHLFFTCRQLRLLLQEHTLCKKIIEVRLWSPIMQRYV